MQIMLEDVQRNAEFVATKQAELDAAVANLSSISLKWARQQAGIKDGDDWILESSDRRQFLVDSAEVAGDKLILRGNVLRTDGQTCSLRRTKTINLQ